MTRAPAEAGAAWTTILASVASSFTAPSHVLFVALVSGWVLTPGRRTITHIITTIDPRSRRPHDAYHRLVRDGTWDMVRLWRTLATVMVDRLVGAEAVVLIDIDDTLFHKSGRRVDGAGLFRDAVRSTRNRVVHALGLNVVVATLRVRPPWPGTPIALPVAARIRRKDDGPSTVDLARAILFDLSVWLPDRQIEVACDGAYSNLCVDRPERVHVTSRIRRNAATYELTPPRTGRRGRPRKKGDRLPPLATMADTASFTHRQIDVRGTTATRLVWSRTLLWYGVTRDTPSCWSSWVIPTGSSPTTSSSPPTPPHARRGSPATTPDGGRSKSRSATPNSPSAVTNHSRGNVAAPNAPSPCRSGSTPPSGSGTSTCGATGPPG